MLRKATPEDMTRVKEIIKAAFAETVEADQKIKEFLVNKFTADGYFEKRELNLFLWDKDGQIEGIGAIKGSEMEKIYVDPQFDTEEVAGKIVAALEGELMNTYAPEVVVRVLPSEESFYDDLGYEKVGEKVYNYPEAGVEIRTIHMKREF
ncbi:MAG: GNAT family N-acetyltransferase [Candidatus Woesearchaeota archaeon]|nr:GNAT family N-acetyltransferase [Candidatus Woesearchaeota archaeon]